MRNAPLSPSDVTVPGRAPRSGGGAVRRLYRFLTSPTLALALLGTVLACCVVGVTVLRGPRAWQLVFDTLWFNGLLVLLAISSAAAFFSRIWNRKFTLVQAGMILFHLSFAALLGGVVVNSLYRFKGEIRLTEGETLPSDSLESYDYAEYGRLFDFGRLRGTTSFVRFHRGYKVGDADKRFGYEVGVGLPGDVTQDVIYINKNLEREGVRYLCAKEGYSVLVVLSAKEGDEVYGGHIPLQSHRTPDGVRYVIGSATEARSLAFPPPPDPPLLNLQLTFRPSTIADRQGEVAFEVRAPEAADAAPPTRAGRVIVGADFDAGDFTLTPREIRYWVGMDVRYDPGLNVILGSLCLGLLGMVLTFVGRIRQGGARRRAT